MFQICPEVFKTLLTFVSTTFLANLAPFKVDDLYEIFWDFSAENDDLNFSVILRPKIPPKSRKKSRNGQNYVLVLVQSP